MKYLDENGLLYFAQKVKAWLGDKADSSALTSHTGNTTVHITEAERTSWNNKVDKVSGKGLSTNDFTTTLKNKLDGISAGAEVNVQADWNETNTSSDAYIKNKPTIPEGAKLYSSTGQNTDGAMTQKAVTDALGAITSIKFEVVTSLPATGAAGTIYLKAHSHGTGDSYDEYIYVNNSWEKIGNTDVDLSGYVTTSTFNTRLSNALDSIGATESGWKAGYNSFTDTWKSTIELNTNTIAIISEIVNNMTAITNAEIDTICTTA